LPHPEDVGRVEAELHRELALLPGTLAAPCRRIMTAGGKRLRPKLVLVAALAAGAPSRLPIHVVQAAAAVELLHIATLIHDDLIDQATTRRGVSTVNAQEGRAAAVIAGDLLLGAAGRLGARISAEAAVLLQQALVDLAAGQALEERQRYSSDVTVQTTLAVAEAKTGTLVGVACQLGALSAGANEEVQSTLLAFGRKFGTMLQLLDDLLDLLSSEAHCGKPVGVDFAAGTVTLPALHSLPTSPELRGLLRRGLNPSERQRALELLRSEGGIQMALCCAVDYANRAEALLSTVDLAGDPDALRALAEWPSRYLAAQLQLILPQYRQLLAYRFTGDVHESR
jgi:geranylgeranyl pyrophosphate synthase